MISRLSNKTRKPAYTLGLFLGAVGFCMLSTTGSKPVSALSFVLLGIAWVTMNAIPFTILTNALDGMHDGTYMGLFNTWICLPQIVATIMSFALYPLLGNQMPHMIMISAVLFIIGGLSVWFIKETSVEHGDSVR